MVILGLTGSIGMGKSTTANLFKEEGIPVYDSDASVHALYAVGGKAVDLLEDEFPGVKNANGAIDRQKLSSYVIGDDAALKKLEQIVHPLVFQTRLDFLDYQRELESTLVVFDIPLLFETGSEAAVDKVIVVTAPFEVQKERVLGREGMTEEKFETILQKQMPDSEKCKRADFVIDTSLGIEKARESVKQIISILMKSQES